jgi:hypothetical protein
MLAQLRPRSAYDVMAALSLFLVIAGGTAYAANTVFSTDIVDGEVRTPDVAAGAVTSTKLAGGAVTSEKVGDNSLGGRDVFDNSLKGADIDESTLTSIGGGGPAGGDLTGSYPNPLIRPNAIGPGKIVNAPSGSDNVNADLLDGLDSSQLSPAGADGRTADLLLTTAMQTVLLANITTARSGALLASAAVSLKRTGATAVTVCELLFDGSASSVRYITAFADVDTLPVVWAQNVEAGPHTVELRCQSGSNPVTVWDAGMHVSAHL